MGWTEGWAPGHIKMASQFCQVLPVIFTELLASLKAYGEARSPKDCPQLPVSMVSISPRTLGASSSATLWVGCSSQNMFTLDLVFLSALQRLAKILERRTGKVYLCVLMPPSIPDSITDSTFLILLKSYIFIVAY